MSARGDVGAGRCRRVTAKPNDIAVLTLEQPLPYRPVRLAASTDSALYTPGTAGTVYGWGLTSSSPYGEQSETLKTAVLPLNSDTTCKNALDAHVPGVFVPGHMVCAGERLTGDDTVDTTSCRNDSGDPLLVRGRVAGIVSWNVSSEDNLCDVAGVYDVYTKVSSYAGPAQARITDTDFTFNGKADLFARTSKGQGYIYAGGTFKTRTSLGTGWNSFNKVVQTDLNRDGYQDFVVRTTGGDLRWQHYDLAKKTWVNTKLFTGWKTSRQILAPGDLTGDALPDLLQVDSGGTLWLYPGKGNGTFASRIKARTGWKPYTHVVGHGDLTNDGKADVVVRGGNGKLYLFPGTGVATKPLGTAKQLTSKAIAGLTGLAATGDVNGDGYADLVVRTKTGKLWLHAGTGKGTLKAPTAFAGSGWNQFTLFG